MLYFGRTFTSCLLIALTLCVFVFIRFKSRSGSKWVAALLPLALTTSAALLIYKILSSIYFDHNWIRLQMSFGFVNGYGPYNGMSQGLVLPSIYGPVSFFAYLPSVLFKSPEAVMMSAETISIAFFFIPALVIIYRTAKYYGHSKLFASFVFLLFPLFLSFSSPLRLAAFQVHADAPGLGFALLACAPWCFRTKEIRKRDLQFSSLCLILAIWTKQVFVPLLVSIPFIVLMISNLRNFARYMFWIIFWGALSLGLFAIVFGFQNLYFNLVLIPLNHPWEEGVLEAVVKLLREILIMLPMFLFALLAVEPKKFRFKGVLEFIRSKRWSILFIAAISMIPASIASKAKVGGSNNALSYVLYFLVVGYLLIFLSSKREIIKQRSKNAAVLLMLVCLIFNITAIYYRLCFDRFPSNFARTAYEFSKKHPETAYFPRLGLISLLAEQKMYHDSAGIKDRKWAGFPIDQEHFDAFIPKDIELIAFRKGADDDMDWSYQEGFSKKKTHSELPEFNVYYKDYPK